MDKTIVIGLTGHADRFRLAEEAYEELTRYLDRAAARLHDDPDRAEVLHDLERSIGDKLAARLAGADRLLGSTDIEAVLDEIGSVETGDGLAHGAGSGTSSTGPAAAPSPRPRRLHRVREGQQLAGVCNGLAAYAELRVDWVRTLFLLATVVTAGAFAIVYVVLAFILPVTDTRDA